MLFVFLASKFQKQHPLFFSQSGLNVLYQAHI